MAKRKTTELTTITAAALADGDWFPVVDVSDTTDSSTGTNKKIAKSELAEAAGLAAHLADTSDAHDASAISYAGSANLSATTVEAALDELDTEKVSTTTFQAHLDDTADAHDASAISVLDTAGNWTATDVEGVLAEVPSRYVARGQSETRLARPMGFVPTSESHFQFLAFGPSNKIYGLDAHTGSRAFAVSTDNMATWTTTTAPNASVNPHACWVLASNTLIVAADDKLYRTTNDGASWTTVLTFDAGTGILANGLVEHAGAIWAADYGPGGKVYRSTDDGATWAVQADFVAGTPRNFADAGRIFHHHGLASGADGRLWLATGDIGAEVGIWLLVGSTWVRQSPVDTDPTTSQKWRAVSMQERNGFLYWGQDTNDGVLGAFWKAPVGNISAAEKLADVPSSAWYSAVLPNGTIVFGSALEGGGGGFQDNYHRLWAIDSADNVHEIWRGRSTATRTTVNTPVYAVRADSTGRIGVAVREMAWHNMATNYRATSYIGTVERGAGTLQLEQPTPRPLYGQRSWLLTATTSDPTTTNTTASADTLPQMDVTIDVRVGVPLLINFTGMFETDANNVRAYAVLEIDGARRSHTLRWTMDSVATVESEIVLSDLFIPPTTQRIRVRVLWFVQSGTGTAIGTDRSMHIVELGR